MQKFMPQSRVWIYRNECTRSTPLDRKLLFGSVVLGCIWDRSVALRYSVENGTNCCNKCKSSSHKVAFEFFCNKSTLSTLGFGAFQSVWVHLGPFRYCMKLGAKWAELVQLMQKFMPRSRVRIFRNECTRSTPLDPKLLFCSIVYGCIWDRSIALRYSVENGTNCCNKCKSSSHKVALEFFATNPPNPLHVLVHFIVFGCTWDHFVTAWNSV